MTRLLETTNLTAHYGDFQALFGVDLCVDPGETVAIIGANGAGKSTFLRALTGLHPTKGQDIKFEGHSIAGESGDAIHKAGLAMVPEGRRLFPSLSVEENLLIGSAGGSTDEEALDYFNKNQKRFAGLDFKKYQKTIIERLNRQKRDQRLRDWFETLRKKYKVRSFL